MHWVYIWIRHTLSDSSTHAPPCTHCMRTSIFSLGLYGYTVGFILLVYPPACCMLLSCIISKQIGSHVDCLQHTAHIHTCVTKPWPVKVSVIPAASVPANINWQIQFTMPRQSIHWSIQCSSNFICDCVINCVLFFLKSPSLGELQDAYCGRNHIKLFSLIDEVWWVVI